MTKNIFSLFLAVALAVTPDFAQDYSYDITKTSASLKRRQLPEGAILYSANGIDPYFANLAAVGWLKDPSKIPQVEAWMLWYIDHFNWPDSNGLYGTVYNYTYTNGIETSTNRYDSANRLIGFRAQRERLGSAYKGRVIASRTSRETNP